MIKFITSVETAKSGKVYATDSKGNPMFGRTPAVTEKLTAGAYANVIEDKQTMTRDADGELKPIPLEEQRNLFIVTAVFPNKAAALDARNEESLFELEAEEHLNKAKAVIAKTYKVDESLAAAI